MERALVLGANGFLGSHIVEKLVAKGYYVKCFDLFQEGKINYLEHLKNKVEIIQGNLLLDDDLNFALKNIDTVFHFVSFSTPHNSFNNPMIEIDKNLLGTIKLLQKCVQIKVKKIIYPSSGGTIYGNISNTYDRISEQQKPNPITPYSITKLTIENFLEYFKTFFGLNYCVLRFSNVYGPRLPTEGDQGVIGVFIKHIKEDRKPEIYNLGRNIRDFIYIDDAIEAAIIASENNTLYNVYNISSSSGYSILDVFNLICEFYNKKIEPNYKSARIEDISRIVLDNNRFSSEFKWHPKIDIHEGIKKTILWYNNI